jgi:hypothetical protein
VLVIGFPTRTMAEGFNQRSKEFSGPLAQAIRKVTGIECRLRAEMLGKEKPAKKPAARAAATEAPALLAVPGESAPAAAAAPVPPPPRAALPSAGDSGEKLVHNVVEVFDGTIVEAHETVE